MPLKQNQQLAIFIMLIIFSILLDQSIKIYMLNLAKSANPIYKSEFIDIILVYNKGVAFSFLSFLSGYLKWIILAMLGLVIIVLLKSKELFSEYYAAFGLIIGSGFSNLIDRFIHNGVVDYIYWHYGFNFAVFNMADTLINLSIAYIIITYLYKEYKAKALRF